MLGVDASNRSRVPDDRRNPGWHNSYSIDSVME
jgi:hypothetical protein